MKEEHEEDYFPIHTSTLDSAGGSEIRKQGLAFPRNPTTVPNRSLFSGPKILLTVGIVGTLIPVIISAMSFFYAISRPPIPHRDQADKVSTRQGEASDTGPPKPVISNAYPSFYREAPKKKDHRPDIKLDRPSPPSSIDRPKDEPVFKMDKDTAISPPRIERPKEDLTASVDNVKPQPLPKAEPRRRDQVSIAQEPHLDFPLTDYSSKWQTVGAVDVRVSGLAITKVPLIDMNKKITVSRNELLVVIIEVRVGQKSKSRKLVSWTYGLEHRGVIYQKNEKELLPPRLPRNRSPGRAESRCL